MKPLLRLCTVACLILTAAGCGTTGSEPIASSTPNALRGQTQFALDEIDLSSMTIDEKAEKDFQASRNQQQLASWDADKAAIRENFSKAARETAGKVGLSLTDTSGRPAFVIRPALTSITAGGYKPFVPSKSRAKLKITITDPSGKPVQEFDEESAVAFDLVGPQSSLGGRLRLAASELGSKTMSHIQELTKR